MFAILSFIKFLGMKFTLNSKFRTFWLLSLDLFFRFIIQRQIPIWMSKIQKNYFSEKKKVVKYQ